MHFKGAQFNSEIKYNGTRSPTALSQPPPPPAPATAQQFSSATFALLRFHCSLKKLGA
jgi:hypothetical protein